MIKSLDELRKEIEILKGNNIDTYELVRISEAIEREVEEGYIELLKDADGERIIRCRDCKHFTPNEEFWIESPKVPFPMIGATSDSCDFWAGTKCKVEPNGFCKWGEPRGKL